MYKPDPCIKIIKTKGKNKNLISQNIHIKSFDYLMRNDSSRSFLLLYIISVSGSASILNKSFIFIFRLHNAINKVSIADVGFI